MLSTLSISDIILEGILANNRRLMRSISGIPSGIPPEAPNPTTYALNSILQGLVLQLSPAALPGSHFYRLQAAVLNGQLESITASICPRPGYLIPSLIPSHLIPNYTDQEEGDYDTDR